MASHPDSPLFPWGKDGTGYVVKRGDNADVPHEVFFEDDYTHLTDRPVFLGRPIPKWKYYASLVAGGCLVLVLAGRAFWMQGLASAAYVERSENNRLRHEVIPAKRGIVKDRYGKVLAQNTPSFDVQTTPAQLPESATDRDALLTRVARIVDVSAEELVAAVSATTTDPREPLTIARDVTYERALQLKIAIDDPAIETVIGNKRQYPYAAQTLSLSHVLGYVGSISAEELKARKPDGYRQTDTIGKTGVESSYESVLRGIPGERVSEVDAHNRPTALVSQRDSTDGLEVTLSLDVELQIAAEKALRAQLDKSHLKRGSVVALDPRDGSVLAMVSLPAYDNNYFAGSVSSTYFRALLNDPDKPLLGRAWAGVFPAGSTVKPVVATAALAEGIVTPSTQVVSTGGLHIGSVFFPDWKAGGHGTVNVRSAIAWSVNTFFYEVGGGYQSFIGLGIDRLSSWLKRFGLGAKTGLDLPGEGSGLVPSKEWKEKTKGERWYVGDSYNLSIGQGDLLVTPLQVANFTAEVANGGKVLRPHVGPISALGATSTVGEQIAPIPHVRTVQAGMRDTVVYGSGRALSSLPFAVAGKTGTAQWRNDRENHAWFTSFAPFENPEIVVTVMVEEGTEGSVTAVPVAKDVLSAWYAGRAKGR